MCNISVSAAIGILLLLPRPLWAGPEDRPTGNVEREGKIQLLRKYIELRDGSPREQDQNIVRHRLLDAGQSLTGVGNRLAGLHGLVGRCERFATMGAELSRQMNGLLKDYPAGLDESTTMGFLRNVRLKILMMGFAQLDLLAEIGDDGGYNVIDRRQGVSCPFEDRKTLIADFRNAVNALNAGFRALYGVPGIRQMDAEQTRLLDIAAMQKDIDQDRLLTANALLVVASVALWETVPPAMLVATRFLWGRTPAMLAWPVVLYGVRTSALAAEGVAANYVGQKIVGDDPDHLRFLMDSWDEHMDRLDSLLSAPLNSPDLYIPILSLIHAQVVGDDLPWFHNLADQIEADEQRFGSIDNALHFYEHGESLQVHAR